mmetsp:Transcript_15741/g.52685  ORF Transcript_15741/g.52685 Transcript_15741/m.52685 type:complete len:149 (-) Transcript_15741:462-908(-)
MIWDHKLSVRRINIETAETVEEVEELGLNVLKDELSKLGMKCGGTLHERAERLWQTKGVEDIKEFLAANSSLLVNPSRNKKQRVDESVRLVQEKEAERAAKREKTAQGPLLEGLERKPGQKKLPSKAPRSDRKQTASMLLISGPGPDF